DGIRDRNVTGVQTCALPILIDCHLRGDAGRFLFLSDQADLLAESIFITPIEGYITRLLWSLVHLGIIPLDAAHDPWGPQLPASEIGRASCRERVAIAQEEGQ